MEVIMENLIILAKAAAEKFLERRGYDVIATDWTCPAGKVDIIAEDEDGGIAFIDVFARKGFDGGFPTGAEGGRSLAERETVALHFLAQHDRSDVPFRFDNISLAIFSEGRAGIKHHVGVGA